jgi:hypothetical protein
MLPKWSIWVILTMVAIVVLVFGWWLFPRVAGLYYQVRGGRLLEEAIQVAPDIQPDDILCAVELTSDETARVLAGETIDRLSKITQFYSRIYSLKCKKLNSCLVQRTSLCL